MKKIFYLGLMVPFILLALTGCAKKTSISTNDFISKTKSEGYQVADATSQFSEYGYVKEATIAQSPEGWQIEFYILQDESYATGMFNNNKSKFESYKNNVSMQKSLSTKNYSTYTLTSNGYYMHLCRIDNTLLYVKVKDVYKSSAEKIIKKLGY